MSDSNVITQRFKEFIGTKTYKTDLQSSLFSIMKDSEFFKLNPLSPGVLDPGNYPGGSSGPTAIFWLFWAFLCPLVSMLNQMQNKGVITDHEENFFGKILKTR